VKQTDNRRCDVGILQEVIAPKKKAKEPCDEEVAQMKSIQAEIKRIEGLVLVYEKKHSRHIRNPSCL